MKQMCDRKCFECKFDDCIEETITKDEFDRQQQMDANVKVRKRVVSQAEREKNKIRAKEYYYTHREQCKEKNKKYYYKIRAFKTINNKNYYGDFSSIVSSETKLATPNIKLSTPKTKTIKISWSKISGAKGYEVYRSNSKKGTYSKISTTNNLSYTNSKLSKKKTYYYKVRAYKVVNNQKVYSSFSSIKSITSK